MMEKEGKHVVGKRYRCILLRNEVGKNDHGHSVETNGPSQQKVKPKLPFLTGMTKPPSPTRLQRGELIPILNSIDHIFRSVKTPISLDQPSAPSSKTQQKPLSPEEPCWTPRSNGTLPLQAQLDMGNPQHKERCHGIIQNLSVSAIEFCDCSKSEG